MKHFVKFIFAMALLVLPGFVSVRAQQRQYTVKVGEFSKLRVVNDMQVRYVCNPDSAGLAVFNTDDRFADAFIFENKGGKLKMMISTDFAHLSDQLPQVTVYSTYIISVENQSALDLTVERPAPCPDISFKQVGNGSIIASDVKATRVKARIATGNGIITLSGECDEAKYEMVGTGRIIADAMMADSVTCTVFGTGSIGCWPIDRLTVKGMGSTTVYYKGTPQTIKKTGIAKIGPMP